MKNRYAKPVSRRSYGQLFRYTLVGIVSNLGGYGLYLVITYLGGSPKATMTVLYATGATIGFFGHRSWTFAHKGNALLASIRYCTAHLCGYLLDLAILIVFVDWAGFPHQLVQLAAVFAVAGFLFLAFKYFVFSAPVQSTTEVELLPPT